MANANSTAFVKTQGALAPIVAVIKPHYKLYTGTKEQLIAHGMALEHLFPVLPKRVEYEVLKTPYGNEMISIKRKKGGLFEVYHSKNLLIYRVDKCFQGFLSSLISDSSLSLVKGESA